MRHISQRLQQLWDVSFNNKRKFTWYCDMPLAGGRQKDFVDTEKSLGRVEPAQISALVGYAGGQVRQLGTVSVLQQWMHCLALPLQVHARTAVDGLGSWQLKIVAAYGCTNWAL